MASISYKECSPSRIIHGTNNYIEYHPGGRNSRLILSVTHGGSLRPKSIPSRKDNPDNCKIDPSIEICIKSDIYTKEIAFQLRDELVKILSPDSEPHMVICNLHRTCIDMNRNILEACLNDPEALIAYKEYHDFLHIAKKEVGKGLLLDIHGHSHKEGLTELGYLLNHGDIANSDIRPECSSVKSLANGSTVAFNDLIWGFASLGRFLNDQGLEAIPSPRNQTSKGSYFSGGYIVKQHGSLHGGDIDAIQVEIHRKHRCEDNSAMFASSLAQAVKEYVDLHYRMMDT